MKPSTLGTATRIMAIPVYRRELPAPVPAAISGGGL
jgi:hypothetical protein